MLLTVPRCQRNGSMSEVHSELNGQPLEQQSGRQFDALIIGRAGMDLYPQPDGCKTRDAESFAADLGGSAGNIAVAIAKAGGKVALLSALSDDSVGEFVRNRLDAAGVDTTLITTTNGDERTSLALAEVRNDDCDVVIYRNNPADLAFTLTADNRKALESASHLVMTGTALIDSNSRSNTIEAMQLARSHGCRIWFDLDYRRWNWADEAATRAVYQQAAAYCDVLVGNEEEFAILDDDLIAMIERCRRNQQFVLLKRGVAGSSLFAGDAQLDSGIFPLTPLKPYGSGDAFLGNLLIRYLETGEWQQAIKWGSAAAALVVAQRGCASAMPSTEQIELLLTEQKMMPAANWR